MLLKVILTFLFGSSVLCAQEMPQEIPKDISDYLATAPAKVRGHIEFDETFNLREESVDAGLVDVPVRVRANRGERINFEFNYGQFKVETEGAIDVVVAGVRVKVNWLYYDKDTGEFRAQTEIIAGVTSPLIERKIQEALNERFAHKMDEASSMLARVRGERNIANSKKMIGELLELFKEPGSEMELPAYDISTTLVTKSPKDQTLNLNGMKAYLKKDQYLESTVRHRYSDENLEITGLVFEAPGGLTLAAPKGGLFTEATIEGVSLSERNGLQIDGHNNVDVLSAAIGEIVRMASGEVGLPPHKRQCECVVQELLDAKITGKLKEYVRSHRKVLRQAGLSERMIRALENDNTDAIDYTEFMN